MMLDEFMENGNTKNVLSRVLREIGSDVKVLSMIMVTEAWISKHDKKDYNVEKSYSENGIVQPSKDSNREEAIIISINSVVSNDLKMFIINRTKDKPFLTKGIGFDDTNKNDISYSGKFVNIINRKNTGFN